LEAAGHRFATTILTETLIHGYEQWAPSNWIVSAAMFSFVLWNRRTQPPVRRPRPPGNQALLLLLDGRLFAFASEIKALLEHPAISPEFEESVVAEYLAFGYLQR